MARLAVTGALAVFALSACNAILGMEHARLDEGATSGTGGAGQTGSGPSRGTTRLAAAQKRACTQGNAACTECLQNCPGYDSCMSDDTCRTSVDGYAYCLGKTCSADAEQCAFDVEVPALKSCLSHCRADCAKSTLASICELYCGCMGQFCDGYLKGDCMQQCQTWPPELASCRRDHCEYAIDGPVGGIDHCLHADGELEACADVGPPMEPSPTCVGYQLSGWACNSQSECCSKTCLDGKCK